ncbi:MAG: T9SS type A sorting domain-containing protein [Bacteroidetes bacterium]|nr:T9SS type A sorting domain-containing protein [Bacteroidota bacterium]
MIRSVKIILLLLITKATYGQPASFVIYPGSPFLVNHAHGVHQAASGSIFLSGYGEDVGGVFSLISFTKFDENGSRLFVKYFGDSTHHFMMMRMLVLDDNNYILAGSKYLPGGNSSPYAVKIDSTGTIIWEKNVNTNYNSYYTGVSRFSNGNLVFAGAASDSINSDLNLMGVITDSLGHDLHSFSFGEPVINETAENCVVSDNGLIAVCGDRLINTTIVNPYVVAFDSTGNFLWEMGISSHNNSGSKNLYLDKEGKLLVVGESATTSSPQFDVQLTKIDIGSVTTIWQKLIPGTNMSDAGFAISETIDGNYSLAGYGHDSISNSKKVLFLITDTSGNELSKKYFGNSSINIGYAISPSVYGGFLIAGADFVSDRQILIYQKELGIDVSELQNEHMSIYPNPVLTNSMICFQQPVLSVRVTDLQGRPVLQIEKKQSFTTTTIPFLNNGLYFIECSSETKHFYSTLIVCE